MGQRQRYDICVIGGGGHAGLPLGLAFADQGQRVVLYDINADVVKKINAKSMPFREEGADDILVRVIENKKLVATTEISVIAQSMTLVVVIGTPVDAHLNPKLQDIMEMIHQMLAYINDEQLIILRSTLYPGVTEKIRGYVRAQGRKTDIAFCPERISEGHGLQELRSLPHIISGYDATAIRRAKELFAILADDPQNLVELSPLEAELAKLFTNTWRYVNFAISNQFYMITNSYGLDFYRIYDAMVQNYPRLQGFARAGFAAGPCLFKDTMQLSAFTSNNFFMGHAAMLVNEGLPNYIIEQVKLKGSLKDKAVGVLGMAFKANSDDPRESLSYKLKKIVELEAKETLCSDPYISEPGFVSAEELIDRSDLVVLATPHTVYRTLDLKKVPVVDIWNFFGRGGRA